MANFWNQSGVPHKGWTFEYVLDIGEDYDSPDDIPYETCMMCGNTGIRFVHVVTHPDIDSGYRVGCDCASKMTDDYVNPEKREAEVKKRSSRLLNWMKKEWKVSAKGNLYTKKNGLHIVLGKNERGRYYYSIDRTFAKNTYPNMLAAKKAIFNSLENMRD